MCHDKHVPHHPRGIVEEDWSHRCRRICNFYRSVWVKSAAQPSSLGKETRNEEAPSNSQVQTIITIRTFRAAIGDRAIGDRAMYASDSDEPISRLDKDRAPIDMGIVLTWEPIIIALLGGIGEADLLSLVHLNNEFIAKPSIRPITPGDVVKASAELVSVWDEPQGQGRSVTVHAKLILILSQIRPQRRKSSHKRR